MIHDRKKFAETIDYICSIREQLMKMKWPNRDDRPIGSFSSNSIRYFYYGDQYDDQSQLFDPYI